MAWNVIAAYILDQVWGYQGANRHRDNLITLASRRAIYPLGGSRSVSLALSVSAENAEGWIDVEIDGTNLGAFTANLRVECRTTNAATSITPKLRNMTDSTDAGLGVACTATNADYSGANQKQTIPVTIASGIKKYRLQGTPGNATNPTFVIGYLEIFATA